MKRILAILICLLFVGSTFGVGTLMANRCGIIINEINTTASSSFCSPQLMHYFKISLPRRSLFKNHLFLLFSI
jgi:hypothetical protein